MTSSELAARMGEGWEPAPGVKVAKAVKGFCTVRYWTRDSYQAEFSNGLSSSNATAKTPEDAVRMCLLSVVRRLERTRRDLEAVLPGVTE